MRPLTRREMIRTSAGTLLAAGLWPGHAAAEPANEFHFVQINDLHYTSQKCEPWFGRVAASIKGRAEKPALVLMCGDLTEDGTPPQLEPVREVLKGFGLPFYSTPGNHDYRTQTDRKPYCL